MNRREFLACSGLVVGASHFAALAPASESDSSSGTGGPRPNILLIMTDQHRFDCLGCMGNSRIHTPHLDGIAADGVRFTSAYTAAPSCTPARAGLLTGLSPWRHGMLGYGRVAERYPHELPRALAEAGYSTFGIGKMHWFPQKALHGFHGTLVDESGRVETPGFVSDYRHWFHARAPRLNPDATGIGWNGYRAGAYALPEDLHPTVWTGDRAVEYIESYGTRVRAFRESPFFLKVSFARPHSPYDPPERLLKRYRKEDMPAPVTADWSKKHAPHDDPPHPNLWHGDLGVDQAKESRRAYYASVTFIDEQVGRIVQALKDRGVYDNTLILFTADHGDMLGDHHLWRKTYAYEGSARIPMLLRWPRAWKAQVSRGSSLPQPVELRDVLPTFLDAAGASIPGDLDGRSLLQLVRGRTEDWRPHIDFEHSVCYGPTNHWNALTDGRFKYIFHAHDGSEQLFNLHDDPYETRDLAADADHASTLAAWRARMVDHLAERGEQFVKNGRLVAPRRNLLYSPHYPG